MIGKWHEDVPESELGRAARRDRHPRARVELSRRNPSWTEIQQAALVTRGRLLVHAESDEMFTYYRGPVFSPGSGSIAFNESVPMCFFVDPDGGITFLERKSGTWSEIVARRARRALA